MDTDEVGPSNGKSNDQFIDRSKVRILLCDNDSKSSQEVFSLLCKCSYQGNFNRFLSLQFNWLFNCTFHLIWCSFCKYLVIFTVVCEIFHLDIFSIWDIFILIFLVCENWDIFNLIFSFWHSTIYLLLFIDIYFNCCCWLENLWKR